MLRRLGAHPGASMSPPLGDFWAKLKLLSTLGISSNLFGLDLFSLLYQCLRLICLSLVQLDYLHRGNLSLQLRLSQIWKGFGTDFAATTCHKWIENSEELKKSFKTLLLVTRVYALLLTSAVFSYAWLRRFRVPVESWPDWMTSRAAAAATCHCEDINKMTKTTCSLRFFRLILLNVKVWFHCSTLPVLHFGQTAYIPASGMLRAKFWDPRHLKTSEDCTHDGNEWKQWNFALPPQDFGPLGCFHQWPFVMRDDMSPSMLGKNWPFLWHHRRLASTERSW